MTTPTIPARPTTYNGIRMRSRLEARFAAALDADGHDWTYEPRAFANERGQYLPDFQMGRMFIEVRPTVDRALVALDRMQIIWDSEPTALLLVTVPDLPYAWAAQGSGERRWILISYGPWS